MASITPRRNPGRIRSSGSSTPVSRTPPRRTSTPTFSASTGTGAGAPPPSSAGQTRRSTRTSDPLGERATVQLIRRVLLPAQHSDQLTAATLLGQLPPLTSSNELDLQVYALLAIVLRDYVQAWYSRITPDDEFVGEIVHIMAHITTAMEQRMRKVDWESLLLDEIPELLEQHVRAYRTAKRPATRPPLQANAREIYHALCPLPAMAPVPEAGSADAETAAAQKANETVYRKLLVQGMLALLLPSDDLQNPCLTVLVGEIVSETIIGGLVASKLAQPWMLWEILAIVANTLTGKKKKAPAAADASASTAPKARERSRKPRKPEQPPIPVPPARPSRWSFQGLIVLLVQWGVTVYTTIRGAVQAVAQARKLPSRSRQQTRARGGGEKAPVAAFRLFSCVGALVELDERMPWLSGSLAMAQWALLKGPWRVGAVDGVLDRYVSHAITKALDSARVPHLVQSIRGSVFPNNMPGKGSLFPPANAAQERALRLKTASALAALAPMWMLRVYFCGGVWGQFDGGDDDEKDADQRVVEEIDATIVEVFADEYCNRHLIYSIVELVFVRLMPELAEKGVEDLLGDRLGV